ncbi:MAG: non-homologous end-joining DNA ligase [Pseudomonadales bacterium]|nr:non-homologous end-joining DNA ligase [Pseudomonadales bacterium]
MPRGLPEVTHPDKILFPYNRYTKREVVEYYWKIAAYMLPFLNRRPLTLKIYPDGIDREGFIQKHVPDHYPDSIPRLQVPSRESGELIRMVAVKNPLGLAWLANQNVLEFHAPLSLARDLEQPDQMIFDLDPSDNDFEKVRELAFALQSLLAERELPAFIKTTGSRGVHIHVPLRHGTDFHQLKEASRGLAESLVGRCPELATLEQRKSARGDRVYIDYLRNEYAMTAIAPYSLRALEGAPVATPIDWEELGSHNTRPRRWHLKNILRRLGARDDPWQDFARHRVDLRTHLD